MSSVPPITFPLRIDITAAPVEAAEAAIISAIYSSLAYIYGV